MKEFIETDLCAAMQEWAEAERGEEAGRAFEKVKEEYNKLIAIPTADQAVQGAEPVADWLTNVADAYGHLWHVNNEPMAPIPMHSPEKAAYEARKILRDMLTAEQRGEAINRIGRSLGFYEDPAPASASEPPCCGWPGNGCPCQVNHEASASVAGAGEAQQSVELVDGLLPTAFMAMVLESRADLNAMDKKDWNGMRRFANIVWQAALAARPAARGDREEKL